MTPSKERVEYYKNLKLSKLSGINFGIPLWESFPKLSTIVPTIDKSTHILISANSGIGKSMFGRYLGCITTFLYVKNNPTCNIDLHFKIFLLEDDESRFKDYIIATFLYIFKNIYVSPKELKSSYQTPVDDVVLTAIEEISEILDSFFSLCDINDSILNPFGIFKYCREDSHNRGSHFYTPLFEEDGNEYISLEEYNNKKRISNAQDLPLKLLRNSTNGNPLDYVEFWKYGKYIPNNPKEHVIVIVDNINCLNPEKGMTLKDSMEKWAYSYARQQLCKHYYYTVISIQQNMAAGEAEQYTNRGEMIVGKVLPKLSDLGDSKLTQRAAHLVFMLFAPNRYNIGKYPENTGYDISRLEDSYRSVFLRKNNDGESDIDLPCLFLGKCGIFKELKAPLEIDSNFYKQLDNLKKRNKQ